MYIKLGNVFKEVIPYIRVAGAWVEHSAFVKNATDWIGRLRQSTKTSVGVATCTYNILASFEWTPPAGHSIGKISCLAWVYQHVEMDVNQATISTSIQGWDGAKWVTLASKGSQGTLFQGEYLEQRLEVTFDPLNTLYTKFKFVTGGNSFNRRIEGFKEIWYENQIITG